jgi:hypothetical protein
MNNAALQVFLIGMALFFVTWLGLAWLMATVFSEFI